MLSWLGSGGMGEVYRARDTRLRRTVAIKVLPAAFTADAERLARFEREARLLASLNHPHIATIHGVEEISTAGSEQKLRGLVLELIEGETLASRLARGPLPTDQALRLAIEIAEALDHAHRRGVTHRDLKPANVMLTKTGVKLLDFGLARRRAAPASIAGAGSTLPGDSGSLTEQGMVVGTLHYMAPEQLEGKETDARTDIFAFGVLLYEMLTARKAFDGDSSAGVIAAILRSEPRPLSTFQPLTPPALDHIVATCLAKDPDARWQSAADIARQLRWVAESGPQSPSVGAAAATRPRRSRWIINMIGVLTAGLIGAAIWNGIRSSATPSLAVTRSSIPIPSTGGWVPQNVALSPDGTRLVYRANNRLYVRALDDLEAKPIAGTDDAAWPFFSPDGEWIGFVSRDKLKRVPLSGGLPLTVCDIPTGANGATWAVHDTIVFTHGHRTGLFKVPATGGTPQALTTLDAARNEKSHRFPQFVPGTNTVLFTIMTAEMKSSDEARIAAVSLDTGERRVLLDGGTSPRFAASGHLVFARHGSLVAVPFDPRRLEIRGRPVTVLDGVTMVFSGAAMFSVAQSGTLAYAAGRMEEGDATIVMVDRRGNAEPLLDARRAFFTVRLSPDGQQLALSIIGDPNDQVWLYDLTRRVLRPVTFAWDNRVWAWTPNGERIVFSSDRAGAYNLYWERPDGSGLERLTNGQQNQEGGSWSPDGNVLVFDDIGETTQGDISMLTLLPQRRVRPLIQTPFDEGEAVLSPDGRWLAYSSDESGGYEVYLQPFPDLDRKWQVSTDGGSMPRWEPHGRELFYRSEPGLLKVMSVAIRPGPVPVDAPRLLFEGRYGDYTVAPDGRFIMGKLGSPRPPITEITLVQNWFEELKRRVPVR